jgi:hypothetical protein
LRSKLTIHQALKWHDGLIGVDLAMAEAAKRLDIDPQREDPALARALLWRRRLIWSSIALMVLFSFLVAWMATGSS